MPKVYNYVSPLQSESGQIMMLNVKHVFWHNAGLTFAVSMYRYRDICESLIPILHGIAIL